jgi:hypothetical protein
MAAHVVRLRVRGVSSCLVLEGESVGRHVAN